MTGKEWSEYFESVNGRKPSEKEFFTAKAEGKFKTEELSNQKKKKRWLLPTIIVAAVLISAAVGTFAYLKLTVNPFDGTWYSKASNDYNSRLTFKGKKIEILNMFAPRPTSHGESLEIYDVERVTLDTQDKTFQMDAFAYGRHLKRSGTFVKNGEELQLNGNEGLKYTFILSKDKTELQWKCSGDSTWKYYKSDNSPASQAKSFFEKYSSQIQQLVQQFVQQFEN